MSGELKFLFLLLKEEILKNMNITINNGGQKRILENIRLYG